MEREEVMWKYFLDVKILGRTHRDLFSFYGSAAEFSMRKQSGTFGLKMTSLSCRVGFWEETRACCHHTDV